MRGGALEVLEGDWLPRMVLLEFDSVEAGMAFYHSPEYTAAGDVDGMAACFVPDAGHYFPSGTHDSPFLIGSLWLGPAHGTLTGWASTTGFSAERFQRLSSDPEGLARLIGDLEDAVLEELHPVIAARFREIAGGLNGLGHHLVLDDEEPGSSRNTTLPTRPRARTAASGGGRHGSRTRHHGCVREGSFRKGRRVRFLTLAIGAVLSAVWLGQDGPAGLPDCGTPVPTGPDACMVPCGGLTAGGVVEYRCRYDPNERRVAPTTTAPQPSGLLTTTSSSMPPPA